MPFIKKRKYQRKKKKQNIKSIVTKMIRKAAETKRLTTEYSTTSISTTMTDAGLFDTITEGTGDNERVGSTVYITGIYARWFVHIGDANQLVRIVCYLPRRIDTTLSSQSQDTPISYIDQTNFKVLYDKQISLNQYGPGTRMGTMKIKFPGKGLPVRYDDDTGAIQNNRIRFAFVSDSGAVTHPTLDTTVITYFKDY